MGSWPPFSLWPLQTPLRDLDLGASHPRSAPLQTYPRSIQESLPGIYTLWLQTLSGAMGIRTPDLLNAIEALYQLSYDPETRNHKPPLPDRQGKPLACGIRYA